MKGLNLLIGLMLVLSLTSCARQSETFYFGDYSEAEAFYNQGEYKKAIQKYQAYMDENSEGNLAVISQYYIAKSHAELGNLQEAKNRFQRIVDKYPDVVWANFSQTQLQELEAAAV